MFGNFLVWTIAEFIAFELGFGLIDVFLFPNCVNKPLK